ncbi:hypothetical protein DIQ79_30465 [Mycolicibacterium smegmatis]|uniref:Uncharacterized protein n=1 Tax=Mycolicibacterium smegmatis (strain ATCC 700084 / mc(2)155) TaxID=246196 RepID=A0QYP0_MYCS2|nr:hypothetical protein MSMEG_3728 [Mycolicibacterium smegmatis MC2 155]TBM39945.1 hypothetical protein DIQ86_26935 [Mycolicibacterium smegmatis]TBH28103.1 hypothetical protein EYS45_29610 [Mycolicibacterium smegmatis MC2 155]TBM44969.1 hypothetical protein DIQ85_30690 [Mycolicibacterium smegmatis]TBM54939.1 hypothetical protein DIQ83_30440 [Mycolicibacterium smegmatis]
MSSEKCGGPHSRSIPLISAIRNTSWMSVQSRGRRLAGYISLCEM